MNEKTKMYESSNESFYDGDSATYDEKRWISSGGAYTDSAQQRIVGLLCTGWQNRKVLEVGPGTARFTLPLLQKGNRVTLTDLSAGMLNVAKDTIESAGLGDNVEAYVKSSVYELPFEESSFDHAISINVFNHLENPGAGLRELARVVRPGSTILFNYANLHSVYWPAARKVNSNGRAFGQDVYSVWESPRKVRGMIADAGLELVKQLGHTHVPRGLEQYQIRHLVPLLDKLSRRGPLRRIAPFHFCLCRK